MWAPKDIIFKEFNTVWGWLWFIICPHYTETCSSFLHTHCTNIQCCKKEQSRICASYWFTETRKCILNIAVIICREDIFGVKLHYTCDNILFHWFIILQWNDLSLPLLRQPAALCSVASPAALRMLCRKSLTFSLLFCIRLGSCWQCFALWPREVKNEALQRNSTPTPHLQHNHFSDVHLCLPYTPFFDKIWHTASGTCVVRLLAFCASIGQNHCLVHTKLSPQ